MSPIPVGVTPLPPGYTGVAYYKEGDPVITGTPWDTQLSPTYSLTPFEGASRLMVRPAGDEENGLVNLVKNLIAPNTQNAWDALIPGAGNLANAINKGGNVWDFIDAAVDPKGIVDSTVRFSGQGAPTALKQVAPAVGAIVGNMVYPVAGAAAGAGIGSKFGGQSNGAAMKNAGLAAVGSYIGGQIADANPYPSGGESSLNAAKEAASSAGATDPMTVPILQDMIDVSNYNASILSSAGSASPALSPSGTEANSAPATISDMMETASNPPVNANLPAEIPVDTIPTVASTDIYIGNLTFDRMRLSNRYVVFIGFGRISIVLILLFCFPIC